MHPVSMTLCNWARGFLLILVMELLWATTDYRAFLAGIFIPGATLMLVIAPLALLSATFFYYLVLQKFHTEIESTLGIRLHIKE